MNNRLQPFHCLCSVLSFVLSVGLAFPAHAAVNDIFPGDYETLPAGMTTVTAYAYLRQAEGPYVQGKKQMNGRLDIPIAAVRISNFIKLGGMSFAPMVVLPWAEIKASPGALSDSLGKDAHGFGDLRLSGTLWLREDTQAREYIGITATVILPTGDYDADRLLNIGNNRTALVLGGGWIKPLTAHVILEIIPEAAFYGDNKEYAGQNRLRQAPTYALGGTLRYHFSSQAQIFSGAQVNRGGATSINGVDQDDAVENTRFSLGASYLTQSRQQWALRYSRDLHIQNGFKTTNELTLRYLVFF